MIAIDQTGSGEPIVLLHGVGATRTVWSRVTGKLAARRLVLAPDLPGFGESPPVSGGFDLASVATALAEPLAARAEGPFDLVGNSLGGAVAVQLAFLRPDLVRGVVLAAPAGFSHAPWPLAVAAGRLVGPAMTARRMVGAPLAGIPAARRVLLWGTIAEPQRMRGDDAARMMRASRASTRMGAAVSAVLRVDLTRMLSQVEVPLGFVWGSSDRVVPISTMGAILAIRPDAAVAVVPRAAHVPQLEQPAQFVSALELVLERLATQPDRHMSVHPGPYTDLQGQ